MKKILLFFAMILMFAATASAQTIMIVKYTDGTQDSKKLVRDVESITFDKVESLNILQCSESKITNNSAQIDYSIQGYYDEQSATGIMYSKDKSIVEAADNPDIPSAIIGENMYFILEKLEPATTYYYKIYVENKGFDRVYTDIREFTTMSKPAEPAFVDLGLSVKWATRNIGAPEGVTDNYGGLYVWGDPTGDLNLSSDLKYLYNVPNNISGGDYDIATALWGPEWRMPTKAEMEELNRLECTREEKYGDAQIGGFKFKASNGKEIFFPSAGYVVGSDGNKQGEKVYTYYWTSEKTTNPSNVYCANIMYGINMFETRYSAFMCAIRPVYIGEDPTEHEGESDLGAKMGRVNLGFDIDWGDRNIGASSVSDYGNYFAWGETETKTDYQLSTYSWLKENYEDDIAEPYLNIGDKLETKMYDVAMNVLWGNWRMPTSDEMNQLINQCTWTWVSNYNNTGVAGYKVTRSPYKGELFFPAGGIMNGTNNEGRGSAVNYWTASRHVFRNDLGMDLEVINGTPQVSTQGRSRGLLIRPVRDRK